MRLLEFFEKLECYNWRPRLVAIVGGYVLTEDKCWRTHGSFSFLREFVQVFNFSQAKQLTHEFERVVGKINFN